MSSIGDKKVALNLSDGTSVNLNKPTVLDSTVTSFLGLKNGEYCGVCTYIKSGNTTHGTIYMPSIHDFPMGSMSTDPGPMNYFLKVMDTIGDDESDSQIFYCQFGQAACIGIGYAQQQPTSLDDNESQIAAQTASNTDIIWGRLASYHDLRYVENKIPFLTDGAFDPTSNYSKNDRTKHTINAHTTDWLADAINLHILKDGVDLNTLLTTGKYAINGFVPVNGLVTYRLDKTDNESDFSVSQLIISDASDVPSTVMQNDKRDLVITNGVLSVDYLGVRNSVVQTLICDQCIARRVITDLTYEYDSSADPIIINRPDTATNYRPWQVIMSYCISSRFGFDGVDGANSQEPCSMTNAVMLKNRIDRKLDKTDVVDNLTSTNTDKALSANQGKELKSLIDDLHVKSIDSSITDLVSIVDSGTYAGTTDFDKTDADNDGKIYYTSSLTNWPGSIINSHGAMSAVAYILRVTAFYAYAEHSVRIYYELHCLNHDIQKAYGIKSNGHINWNYGGTHVEDSLESYMPQYALSANQGRVLNDKISNLTKSDVGLDRVDNTADADKSVKSATTATTASKLGSSTVGSGTKPVYLDGGLPKASTDTVGSASNPVYMKNGTITAGAYTFSASTTDLTAGTSTLATNEIRFIYE